MKVALGLLIYNESIRQIKRVIYNTNDIRDELIVKVHNKHYKFIREYLKQISNTYIESDMDETFPEEDYNEILSKTKNKWILRLDPDEFLDIEAIKSIKQLDTILKLHPDVDGFYFARNQVQYWQHNKLLTKVHYPDYQLRLFRTNLRYSGRVHRNVNATSLCILPGNIIHDHLTRLPQDELRLEQLFKRNIRKYDK